MGLKEIRDQAILLAEGALEEAKKAIYDAKIKGLTESELTGPRAKVEALEKLLVEIKGKRDADSKHKACNATDPQTGLDQ